MRLGPRWKRTTESVSLLVDAVADAELEEYEALVCNSSLVAEPASETPHKSYRKSSTPLQCEFSRMTVTCRC